MRVTQQQIVAVVTNLSGEQVVTVDPPTLPPGPVDDEFDDDRPESGSVPGSVGRSGGETVLPDFGSVQGQDGVSGSTAEQQASVNSSETEVSLIEEGQLEQFSLPASLGFDRFDANPATADDRGLKVELDLSNLNEPELWQSMTEASAELQQQDHFLGLEVRSLTLGGSVALTSGVVAWALRGGALATSLMASVPALSFFNPMLVVIARRDVEVAGDAVDEMFLQAAGKAARGVSG